MTNGNGQPNGPAPKDGLSWWQGGAQPRISSRNESLLFSVVEVSAMPTPLPSRAVLTLVASLLLPCPAGASVPGSRPAGTHAADEAWPQFRGPDGQGHAAGRALPATWGEKANITWKVAVAGLGWSSPVIRGEQVWLTTATRD